LNQTKTLDFKLVKILLYFRAEVHVLDYKVLVKNWRWVRHGRHVRASGGLVTN